ncbi:MAG: DUF5009 domain-containing protein, partial [Thermoguttaceae bacterium]|nr:DUF5009 domain-containing protein [Thermoguttaceae bacterium]
MSRSSSAADTSRRASSANVYPLASDVSRATSPVESQSRSSQRLMSLDALRGLNMLFIIGLSAVIVDLCNLWPGAISSVIAEQMTHVEWNGIRHHDTIFPLFLFLAGASFPFSLAKARAKELPTWRVVLKVVFRGLALVALGVIYNNGVNFDFANLRYGSVLGHIGLAWMFAALIFMATGRKFQICLSAVILVGYWLALTLYPAPDVNPPEAFTKAAFMERA